MTQAQSTPPIESKGDAGVLVIHCSDPRYQTHFQDFLRNALRLDRYALIAVPGGAQFLTLVDYLPKFSWAGWRWVKFLVDLLRPERVILIAHDDCRWYLNMRFVDSPERLRERLAADLRRVRSSFTERFGGARVELYFARLDDSGCIFEPL